MELTELLKRLHQGDREALDQVIPLVYQELKKLAAPEPLQTTAPVHETFLRLVGTHHFSYENRSHFYGIASRLMRQILVDAARHRAAEKRNDVAGGTHRPPRLTSSYTPRRRTTLAAV
ncbi:MAG TPA: ECF-type sigma factor [Bryobacteraceae bacterium]|jgi:DNA-directed RNA polymerase specialized sigma24 family protein